MQKPNDILQPLPFDKWPGLKNSLKRDWPLFIHHYYWVDNAIKWKTREPNIKLDIYCPEGKYQTGVFMGVEAYSTYCIVPFAFEESRELLQDCIIKTKLIDWSKGVAFEAVHKYFENAILKAVEHLEKTIHLKLDKIDHRVLYFKYCLKCSEFEFGIPEGMEMRPLLPIYAQSMHDSWPHSSSKKPTDFFETLIKFNEGIGMFKSKDNSLVSWIVQGNWGGLGFFHTLEEYQGKGYGKIVANELTEQLANKGQDVTVSFELGNVASTKVFTALNFKRISEVSRISMKPLISDCQS